LLICGMCNKLLIKNILFGYGGGAWRAQDRQHDPRNRLTKRSVDPSSTLADISSCLLGYLLSEFRLAAALPITAPFFPKQSAARPSFAATIVAQQLTEAEGPRQVHARSQGVESSRASQIDPLHEMPGRLPL
jgi:hypothetical protein